LNRKGDWRFIGNFVGVRKRGFVFKNRSVAEIESPLDDYSEGAINDVNILLIGIRFFKGCLSARRSCWD